MHDEETRIDSTPSVIFGPVPSRRLGRSVGINNIPPKVCSYSCRYCQVGKTLALSAERRRFYSPESLHAAVEQKVRASRESGERIDYLTFVPDGEPTLDISLGRAIDLLRPLGIPIAVITNASLVWRPEVRSDLVRADWISLKLDAADKATWRRIDRPHKELRLEKILEGMFELRSVFGGQLVTETMLVDEVNTDDECLTRVASFISRLRPTTAYLSIPTRPPAERSVSPPTEMVLNRAFQTFSAVIPNVEYLTGYEGDAFAATGDPESDLLGITAVHPMQRSAVDRLLSRTGSTWDVVERLITAGRLAAVEFRGETFFVRRFRER